MSIKKAFGLFLVFCNWGGKNYLKGFRNHARTANGFAIEPQRTDKCPPFRWEDSLVCRTFKFFPMENGGFGPKRELDLSYAAIHATRQAKGRLSHRDLRK